MHKIPLGMTRQGTMSGELCSYLFISVTSRFIAHCLHSYKMQNNARIINGIKISIAWYDDIQTVHVEYK